MKDELVIDGMFNVILFLLHAVSVVEGLSMRRIQIYFVDFVRMPFLQLTELTCFWLPASLGERKKNRIQNKSKEEWSSAGNHDQEASATDVKCSICSVATTVRGTGNSTGRQDWAMATPTF